MSRHPLSARLRRLELRIAKATQPGIGEMLRLARERQAKQREVMGPNAGPGAEDLARWHRLAADPNDTSIAARLARARLRRMVVDE